MTCVSLTERGAGSHSHTRRCVPESNSRDGETLSSEEPPFLYSGVFQRVKCCCT